MIDNTTVSLRASKNARIIEELHTMLNKSLEEATEIFYTSQYCDLIEEGIADLHCRSDKYLASLICDEWRETKQLNKNI